MTDNTDNLVLPYIQPAQAQKHITHNSALKTLDAVVQLTIVASLAAPPASPVAGKGIWVLSPATGAFAGKENRIAFWQDQEWVFLIPWTGWIASFTETAQIRLFDGTQWNLPSKLNGNQIDMLGVSAVADATNRLSVSSPGSLFNHAGTSHRMVINKASAADNASLLFQTGFSGRAELALGINDTIQLKTSSDGTNWKTALDITSSGLVRQPQRPAVRASYGEVDLNRPNATTTGFNNLSVNQGGFSLGAAVPNGVGQKLIIPTTGLYHVVLSLVTLNMPLALLTLVVNGLNSFIIVKDQDNSSLSSTGLCANSLYNFTAGDTVWILHTGTGDYRFGQGKTELMMVMV